MIEEQATPKTFDEALTAPRMTRLVLTNDYHGTRATVLVPAGTSAWDAWIDITNHVDTKSARARERRVRRALCPSGGLPACACGVVRAALAAASDAP